MLCFADLNKKILMFATSYVDGEVRIQSPPVLASRISHNRILYGMQIFYFLHGHSSRLLFIQLVQLFVAVHSSYPRMLGM